MAILCALRERAEKEFGDSKRIEVMNSGFFNALRIVSCDTALDRGPPAHLRAVLKSIIKNRISRIDYQKSIIKIMIDYQKSIIKNRISIMDYQKLIIKNRISIIDYQKSIIKNRISIIDYQKSIIKNRISKIDYQIDCQRSFTCKSKINCKKSIN